ncbi:TonB-dependent receptor [Nevskia ramosa]|uniref:TonB-dependent receptor n=1 Tax=Nevskia ramosa TaxID=64002 RepID=UPI0003B57DA3|nr:TonB-dependent receptor [Nevskia ramosa]
MKSQDQTISIAAATTPNSGKPDARQPRRRLTLGSAASVALLYLWAAPALAQELAQSAVVPPAAQPGDAAQPASESAAGVEVAQTEVAKAEVTPGNSPAVLDEVQVTARRKTESLQKVPIAVSVINGDFLNQTGAFNVNRLKEALPSVQFYSTNPRNSALNIRGLGAPYGLTNDGIEQGVGLYIDGVYFARPAAATLDFIDVEQIEVLRGPQGTLYGKNTTAGAVNVTTKKPSFTPGSAVELSYGNYGYVQGKASLTGPLTDDIAARISFSGTQRDGFLYNVATQDDVNDLSNLGIRGQILYNVLDNLSLTFAGDWTRQRPEGYTQVVAGVAPTLRAENRQYAAIAASLNYTPPSFNAFDRLTDVGSPIQSYQDLGGGSLTADWDTGYGKFTSISAYRVWDWRPSNDRDFIGLPVNTVSAATSYQEQLSQEFRFAGDINDDLNYVVGLFGFHQVIKSNPVQTTALGSAASRWLLAGTANASNSALLDGLTQRLSVRSVFDSAALFGQLEWKLTDQIRVLPGLRLNYDRKKINYDAQVSGGQDTSNDPALRAVQLAQLPQQTYADDIDDTNVSGQITLAYNPIEDVDTYATYSRSFKTVGLNTAGVPNIPGTSNPDLSLATIKPEKVAHYEIGIKTRPFRRVTVNLAAFNTDIKDFQAQVQDNSAATSRGYLANADKVRVRGVEFDSNARFGEHVSVYAAATYTDGKYRKFTNAPLSLENTGRPRPNDVEDISGSRLPGISKFATSLGGELFTPGSFLGRAGDYFTGADFSYRSGFSSSATPSDYLNVDGYELVNARIGFRSSKGWDLYFWTRNLFDKHYYELLSPGFGGTGLYVGQPGDPRTFGVTFRAEF